MTDAIEEKIDGLKAVTETRFAHLEKEQAGMVAWMERLSASVDRLVDFGSSLLAVQQRTSNVENMVRDQALDIDGLDHRLSDIESSRKADNLKGKWVEWLLALTGGAFATLIVQKILGE